MRTWVKDVIRSNHLAYLSVKLERGIRILPFSYTYDSGRLIGVFSILQALELEALKSYPTHALSLMKDEYIVNMLGQVRVYEDDLDFDWEKEKNIKQLIVEEQTQQDMQDYDIIQRKKQVAVEFIPSRIMATDGTEQFDYEMEIL